MCNYIINGNRCGVNNHQCPYMYYCNTKNTWKPLRTMPEHCKVGVAASAPKGSYFVRDARKGFLYIDIDGVTIKLVNPFDFIPQYVQLSKTKDGWKIKK